MTSYRDWVVETSSTTGTGTYSLSGSAPAGTSYFTFRQRYSNGEDEVVYWVVNSDRTKWEKNRFGTLTYGTPDTLSRNVVESTNGDAPVSWVGGDGPLRIYVTSDSVAQQLSIENFHDIAIQKFTSSGTYTPNAKMVYCKIESWGAGGGGGSVASGSSIGYLGAGGGGGAYSEKMSTAADIGASKAVTIGAGGTAATAGANAGGDGGDTSVGTLCVAKGGSGGPGFTSTTPYPLGGAGGAASSGTGDVKLDGGRGCGSSSMIITSGHGATGGYGGGAPRLSGPTYPQAHTAAAVAGVAAEANSGAGGAGAWCLNTSNAAGGAGGSGYVVITEFLKG